MPTVTIGLPVFNGERFLELALRSILAQTFEDFELLIADNASADRTPAICQDIAASDRRVRYHRNTSNIGAAGNYNLLVEKAQGQYFKWAAYDDLLEPTHLEFCLRVLQAHPEAVLSYPSTAMIDQDGALLEEDPLDVLPVHAATPHDRLRQYLELSWLQPRCNAVLGLIRRDILRQTRLIGRYASSDKVLLSELCLYGTFVQLPQRLFYRRAHAASSVAMHRDLQERMAWFDPSRSDSFEFAHLRWWKEYLAGIAASRISPEEKLRCMWATRYYVKNAHDRMRGEITGAIRRRLRLPVSPGVPQ